MKTVLIPVYQEGTPEAKQIHRDGFLDLRGTMMEFADYKDMVLLDLLEWTNVRVIVVDQEEQNALR